MGMSHLRVVDFPVQVSLAGIPGRLRQLADEYEAGKGDGLPRTLVFIEGHENGKIKIGCFGDCPSRWEVVGLLTLAGGIFNEDD